MNLIQQRILQTLGQQGPILVGELGQWLKDVDHVQLDVNVTALMREQRVTKSAGCYEVGPVKVAAQAKTVARAVPDISTTCSPVTMPPTAEEESAANLQPPKRVFHRCRTQKELNRENFSRNRHGFLKICKSCYRVSVAAGLQGKSIPVIDADTRPAAATVPTSAVEEATAAPITVADSVLERVKAQRQEALNRIAVHRVDIANLESKVAECDQFFELYKRLAQGAN